jgi:hypothetical protein
VTKRIDREHPTLGSRQDSSRLRPIIIFLSSGLLSVSRSSSRRKNGGSSQGYSWSCVYWRISAIVLGILERSTVSRIPRLRSSNQIDLVIST